MLFPVRLETRFFTLEDGSSELRVRVYPDTVHMDSHEPGLTADELTWGQHFWEQTWRAANDEQRAKAAWQQLVERFDAPRAAWIAHALKPLNPTDRPSTPIATDQPLPKPVRFPSPETQAEAWMRAPHTRVLPNRWIVLGYHGGQLVANVTGGVIPDSLATGPHPPGPDSNPAADLPDDQLAIDAGMKWMVDFDEAEKVGMGIRVKLTKEAATVGFDFVLVMGIKDTQGGTTDWSSRLAELFNAHHYTYGMSFVPPGTPSNNTQDAPSGFSTKDPGHEVSYEAERSTPVFQAGDGSNADVLTTAFGLPQGDQTFATLSSATAKEQLDARHMNRALWQATWGYFLLQMLGVGRSDESPLTGGDITWARSHFIDYVRANGPLPAIRIGKQPYGILPVTSLDAWKPEPGSENQSTQEVVLRDFLLRLRNLWRGNYAEIPRLGRSEDGAKDLAEVLSMEGLSSSYSIRNLIGRHYLEHLWVFLVADFASNIPNFQLQLIMEEFHKWFAMQEDLTATVLKALGVTWRPRLARAVYAPPIAVLHQSWCKLNTASFYRRTT